MNEQDLPAIERKIEELLDEVDRLNQERPDSTYSQHQAIQNLKVLLIEQR